MKKIIALLVTVLVLLSALSLPVFATETPSFDDEWDDDYTTVLDSSTPISFANDYKTLYFGKEKYVSIPNKYIQTYVLAELDNPIKFTAKQKAEVSEIILTASYKGALIDADIYFFDGSNTLIHFIKQEYVEEYKTLFTDKSIEYEVNFEYPDGNTVPLSRNMLIGKEITISDIMDINDYFEIIASTKDESISVAIGKLLLYKDEYYYFDYQLNNSSYIDDIYDRDTAIVTKITNQQLIKKLKEAEQRYYEEDMGFFFDDSFTSSISDIFLVIIFAILPFAAFVVFTVIAIRSKGTYRKLSIIINSLIIAELAIFTVLALLIK